MRMRITGREHEHHRDADPLKRRRGRRTRARVSYDRTWQGDLITYVAPFEYTTYSIGLLMLHLPGGYGEGWSCLWKVMCDPSGIIHLPPLP